MQSSPTTPTILTALGHHLPARDSLAVTHLASPLPALHVALLGSILTPVTLVFIPPYARTSKLPSQPQQRAPVRYATSLSSSHRAVTSSSARAAIGCAIFVARMCAMKGMPISVGISEPVEQGRVLWNAGGVICIETRALSLAKAK